MSNYFVKTEYTSKNGKLGNNYYLTIIGGFKLNHRCVCVIKSTKYVNSSFLKMYGLNVKLLCKDRLHFHFECPITL